MRSARRRGVFPVVALVVAMTALIAGQAGAKPSADKSKDEGPVTHKQVCDTAPAGYARCHAEKVTGGRVGPSKKPPRPTTTIAATTSTTKPATTTSSSTSTSTSTSTTSSSTTTTVLPGTCSTAHDGLTPCDLTAAYGLPGGGSGVTVAIVDAFDNPNAESDLAVYRAAYGLTPCTTANGCFRKVNQNGGTAYPAPNAGWAEEIALDLDMVSAVCPGCNILLVEATNNSLTNLGIAVNRAVTMGAKVVSNSYGAGEFSTETSYESYYNHPGVAITVSSGDSGYGVQFPAASRYVTAVGGTSLSPAGNGRGWTETVWSGAGSGCSAYIAKPVWQTDACARRTVADVSAVANPATGVAVYNTYAGDPGWLVFGGTSVSAPIVGAVYALSGNTGAVPAALAYSHTASLFDITSGSNGSCGGSYLCTGAVGYDGPTGLGTPNGVGAF